MGDTREKGKTKIRCHKGTNRSPRSTEKAIGADTASGGQGKRELIPKGERGTKSD